MIIIKQLITFYLRFIVRTPRPISRVLFFIPDWRTFLQTALNELSYILRRKKGFQVTSVSVELSARCNLDCKMCARHSVMTRKEGFMSLETFRTLVDNNPDVHSYTLVGWGEMMLNPHFFEAIAYLRDKGKRIAMTSNATLFTDANIEKILPSGISHITLSMDGMDEVYTANRGIAFAKVERNLIALAKRIRESHANIYLEINSIGHPEALAQEKEMRTRLGPHVDDIRFSSHLEYNQLLPTNRSKPCREFWRGMITVLHDGSVVPCCMDYNASMVLGHVAEGSLLTIWNNKRNQQLRDEQLRLEFKHRCATCYELPPPDGSTIEKRFD
ncbi:MAG: radical SAM protein [Magnetococcales bacterium]|nr:radical SAM protein [Magnetococcales bacterium]